MKTRSSRRSSTRALFLLAIGLLFLLQLGWSMAQTLTVFAASSLTESFQEIAQLFEEQNPGVDVALNFAGSSTLSLQIIEGAPADVFASADQVQMQRVADAELVTGDSALFATNRLVVIAPSGSTLSSFAELAGVGVALVMAGPEVPVGRYAREAIASYDAAEGGGFAAAVLANVVSEEQNVRLVATKVDLGEADAGIVYSTDAAAFPGLVVVDVPAPHSPLASYEVASLTDAPQPELAAAFVALVLSPDGKAILAARGFGPAER
ncbi:MAG TPA: molybdate ABC transporter substrate-binding protein [Trueperaceae bacterium]|nr:molybdate ABC transporter substrate-binding protein [Trueperaceae bacterium]